MKTLSKATKIALIEDARINFMHVFYTNALLKVGAFNRDEAAFFYLLLKYQPK